MIPTPSVSRSCAALLGLGLALAAAHLAAQCAPDLTPPNISCVSTTVEVGANCEACPDLTPSVSDACDGSPSVYRFDTQLVNGDSVAEMTLWESGTILSTLTAVGGDLVWSMPALRTGTLGSNASVTDLQVGDVITVAYTKLLPRTIAFSLRTAPISFSVTARLDDLSTGAVEDANSVNLDGATGVFVVKQFEVTTVLQPLANHHANITHGFPGDPWEYAIDYIGVTRANPCLGTGVSSINFLAEDADGNDAVCTSTVTVTDTTPPALSCPGDQTLEAGTGCQACPDLEATADDACLVGLHRVDVLAATGDSASEVVVFSAGTVVPDGLGSLTWSSPSGTGTIGTQISVPDLAVGDFVVVGYRRNAGSLTVTVVSAPISFVATAELDSGPYGFLTGDFGDYVIEEYEVTNVLDPLAAHRIRLARAGSGAWDVDIDFIGVRRTASDCRGLGVTTATWIADDEADNVASCSATITVQDTTPPVLDCPPDQTLEVGAGCEACPDLTVDLADDCIDEFERVEPVLANGDSADEWQAAVTPDGFGNIEYTGSGHLLPSEAMPTPVIGDRIVVGYTKLTGNNMLISLRQAFNNLSLRGTLNGASEVSLPGAVNEPRLEFFTVTSTTASTEYRPDIRQDGSGQIRIDFIGVARAAAVDCFGPGVTEVIWAARDLGGAFTTCSASITVTDTVAPALTCPADITVIDDGDCSECVALNASATDDCATEVHRIDSEVVSGDSVSEMTLFNSTNPLLYLATDGFGSLEFGSTDFNQTGTAGSTTNIPDLQVGDTMVIGYTYLASGASLGFRVMSGPISFTSTAQFSGASTLYALPGAVGEYRVAEIPITFVNGSGTYYPHVVQTVGNRQPWGIAIDFIGVYGDDCFAPGDSTVTFQAHDTVGNVSRCQALVRVVPAGCAAIEDAVIAQICDGVQTIGSLQGILAAATTFTATALSGADTCPGCPDTAGCNAACAAYILEQLAALVP